MFTEFEHKIIHVVVDLPHKNDAWANEKIQRNAIDIGIKEIKNIVNSDLIIISDLDEIPDLRYLPFIEKPHIFEQDFYYYNLNTKNINKWEKSLILSYEDYLKATPDEYRYASICAKIKNGGWHLSYFGDEQFIINKLQQYSHSEYSTGEFIISENIKQHIKNNEDLFNRGGEAFKYIPISNNTYLPPNYQFNLETDEVLTSGIYQYGYLNNTIDVNIKSGECIISNVTFGNDPLCGVQKFLYRNKQVVGFEGETIKIF